MFFIKYKYYYNNGKEYIFKRNKVIYKYSLLKKKKIFHKKNVNDLIKIEIKKILNKYDYELYESYIKKLIKLDDIDYTDKIKEKEEIDIIQNLFSILRKDQYLINLDEKLSDKIIEQIAKCIVACYKNHYEEKEDFFYVPITMIVKYIFTFLIDYYHINKTHEIIKNIIVLIWNNEQNIYKNYSKKKKNLEWNIKIYKKDVTILNNNFYYDIYYKKPPLWRLDKNTVFNDINEINIVRESNYYINNFLYKYINKKYINYINLCQNQSYKIDKSLFYDILKKYNIDFFIYTKNTDININPTWIKKINIDDYVSNIIQEKYNDLSSTYKKKKYDYLKNQINKINLYTNKVYKIHINIIIILAYLTSLNEKKKIYHKYYIDKRGRVIYDGLLNYVNSKFIRYLTVVPSFKKKKINKIIYNNKKNNIEMNKLSKFYISNQIKKNVSSFLESEEIYNSIYLKLNIDNIFNKKNEYNNIYNLYKIVKYGNNSTVSLDASSSAMQILSVLSKNEKLMMLTNAIQTKGDEKKKDIYNYLIDILKIKYKLDIFYDYYINRKIVKYVCMTYFYGSTPKYIAEAMIEKFKLNSILKIDLIMICNNIITLFNIEIKVVSKIKKLLKFYLDILPEEFDINCKILDKKLRYNCIKKKKKSYIVSIKESRDFIINIINKFLKNVMYISVHIDQKSYIDIFNDIKELKIHANNGEFINNEILIIKINNWYKIEKKNIKNLNEIEYWINEINEYKIINNKLFKNKTKNVFKVDEYIEEYSEESLSWITTQIESNEFCKKTKNRTTLVNIIHSIESQICLKTRYILKKKYNINSLSIHDCFLVRLKNYAQVIKVYNEVLLTFNNNIYNIIIDLKPENIDKFFEKVIFHMTNNEDIYLSKIIKILKSITKNNKAYKKYYSKNDIDIHLFKKDINISQFLIEHWIKEKKVKYMFLLNELKKEETWNNKEINLSPFCLQPE